MDGECQLHKDIKNKSDVRTYGNMPIKLGQVEFINCLPINLPIELNKVDIDAEIISDVPSKLNEMILRGEIDIAPVSSFAYIENKDKLAPIANLCISSNGPADSVLLFSRFPIEELDGAKIALSPASSTSNKLLQIIFKDFIKIIVRFEIASVEAFHEMPLQNNKYAACLLIGDQALLEYSKMPRNIFIYDLGSLWKKYTNLPMVFGIWVARKEIIQNYPEEIEKVSKGLNVAKQVGLNNLFDSVIRKAQERVLISKEFYTDYFKHLSYELTSECKNGLKYFDELCSAKSLTQV